MEFRPAPTEQRPTMAQYAQQWGRSLNDIGSTFQQMARYRQEQEEKQKSERMASLTLGLSAQDKGIDPSAILDYYRTGNLPQSPSTQPPMFATQPGQGQFADAGMPDTGYAGPERSTSPHIEAWNNHPDLSQFAPRKGRPQSGGFASLFQRPDVDVGGVMDQMAKGDYSGWSKASPYLQSKIQGDPRYKQLVKQQEEGYVPVSHATVLMPELKGREAELNAQYPEGIPRSDMNYLSTGMKLSQTRAEKEDQFNRKRLQQLGETLDPSKMRGGAFSGSKTVFDRAERLQSLASAMADGNLDSRQIEELAIGLNSMLSGSNTGAQHQVESLVPRTVWGNAQKLAEFLTNKPRGMKQQAFVQRMLGSVEREKQTALEQMNRTRFSRIAPFADLERVNPSGFYDTLRSWDVDPADYAKWKRDGFKQKSAVQNPEDSGPEPITQRNKKTRQIRTSYDGGKTWQMQ